ncbi:MAG TPA: hypothetical protein VNP95_00285, partial [Thermomicrobiales bacterium]|nr:hypothetical protein [Thermomicrobiales bacterium]
MVPPRLTRRSLIGLAAGTVAGAAILPAPPCARATATPVASPLPLSVLPEAITTAYTLDVRLATKTRILGGRESIAWRNTTGRGQDTLFLRLYPNAAYYGDGETTISGITVDGRATQSPPGDDPTVATIPLGR